MRTGMLTLALWAASGLLHQAYAQSTPYYGTPMTIPGTIQAEDYDAGGEGVAYHDSTPENLGGAYRMNEGVDVTWGGSGYVVGWVPAGEWLNYTVNVAATGSYTVTFSVACLGPGGTFHLEMNGTDVTGPIAIPDTGWWDNWTTVSKTVYLYAGDGQVAKLVMDSVGYWGAVGNFDWMQFTQNGGSGGGTLTMMTWNIDFGCSDDSCAYYALPDQIQFMADSGADVIVLQEVSTYINWDPELYRAGLQSLTGQPWYAVWVPGTGCLQGGCIGEEILSRIPISDSATTYLGPSSAGRALIYVGGVPINVFTNHLEAYDFGLRWSELLGLMDFARQFGGPALVGGDFNSWWCECEGGGWCYVPQMQTEYSDSWVDTTGSEEGGYTVGAVRFDYIFRAYNSSWRLAPQWSWIGPDWLSDHRPLIVQFQVQ